jgi:transglutaminase-like putative cysteine protease
MPTLAANSRARLNRDELHQLRWLLGLALVLLAFWTLFGLDIGGITWRAVFLLTAASAFIWPAWPGYIPNWIRRWSLILGATALISEITATHFDVLSGLVLLVSLLTLSRGLQYRRLREDWQLILLCLFIIVLSGVLTLDLLFGLQILLFTIVTMALLFVMNLLQRDASRELSRDDWRQFRWRHFMNRVWQAVDLRQLAQATTLFGGLVLVGTLIFVAMPRYQFEQSFSFAGVKGVAGFRGDIQYSEKFSIDEDDSIAFRVDAPENFKFTTATPYWRMIVLDDYRNNGFKPSNPSKGLRPPEFRRFTRYPELGSSFARPHLKDVAPVPGVWRFYLEGNVSEYLPILGTFDNLTFSSTQSFYSREDMQVYRIEQPSAKVLGYEIENMTLADAMPAVARDVPPNLTLAEVDAMRAHAPFLVYPYTYFGLPEQPDDRAILDRIVKEIEGARTNLSLNDFNAAAVDYLNKHHPPAMKSDLTGKEGNGHDLLVRWLNTPNSPGWCEYFAGAFVLLARDAGFPARVVAGYKGAVYNPMENYYSVNQRYAHAWAEVFDGKDRWVRVDPLPGTDVSLTDAAGKSTNGGIVSASGWNAYLDSLRMIWYRRIINFDQTDQAQLIDTVEQTGRNLAQRVGQWFNDSWQAVKIWVLAPMSATHYFILGSLLAALVLAWWQASALRNFWLRLSGNQWLGRMNRLSPVRLNAGRWLRRFEPVWLEHLAERPLADRPQWNHVRGELLALRYGPPNHAINPAQTFKEAARLLRSVKTQPARR